MLFRSRRILLAVALAGAACAAPLVPSGEETLDALPSAISAPARNPVTEEKRALGKLLFWEPLLSGDRDVSCATCHDPAHGYTDGRARAVGTGGRTVARNAPTILDIGWNGLRGKSGIVPEDAPMFWDNRARSLEEQARGPLHGASEMRGETLSEADVGAELARRLTAIPDYRARFDAAFGPGAITEDRIVMAIASFERTIANGTSPFDRFVRGDASALSLAQRRGLVGFFAAGCGSCHAGPMFSDFTLHDLGAGVAHPELGVDHGDGHDRFRTPTLRNVARTAPYMHDGSLATLEDVYDFYLVVDRSRDDALGDLRAVVGSARKDMISFLDALTDDAFDATPPDALPSGLPVGGLRRAPPP